MEDPVTVRWRVLLAISGLSLPQDGELMELSTFRGTRPELLGDAGLLIRIFGVVDAFEVLDEYAAAQLAQSLLGVEAENFPELVEWAGSRCSELVRSLKLGTDPDADWSNRLWVQQQVTMLTALLNLADDFASIQSAHEFIARSLFRQVPLLLVETTPGRYQALNDGDVGIHADSSSSAIARVIREGERRRVTDHADLSVGDRQLLRRMGASEVTCVPVATADQCPAVLLMVTDEDVDFDFALTLYVEALGQRLNRLGGDTQELDQLKKFRLREEKRLRELVHEANNPLSVVQNYLHILQMRLQHETTAAEQLEMIGSEIRRASEIIQRARDVTPITDPDAEAQIVIAELDVNDLARRVQELHLGYAADHNVRLSLEIREGSLLVQTDEHRLAQIMNNLVRNGIEAAAGESVTVGTDDGIFREGREGVEIYVRDSGPGLPRTVLERLADPKESTKGGDHAGLGLHIVHRLVGELGANIDVRTSTGHGTSFSVYLPLDP
jgi:signal transduction histidine kinase